MVDGFWRLLDFQYTARCVSEILQLIDDNSWDWRKFPFKETLDTLCVLEPRLILEIFLTDWFAQRIIDGTETFFFIEFPKKFMNLIFGLKLT